MTRMELPVKLASVLGAVSILTVAMSQVFAEGHSPTGLEVEVVSEFNDIRPANLTVTPQGRIIATMHPLDNAPIRMMEVTASGTQVPWPTMDWADGPEKGLVGITQTVGIDTDPNGVVWILDMGGPLQGAQFMAWDTIKNTLHARVPLPQDSYLPISFLQDFALDDKRNMAYIADMTFTLDPADARPAIVVVNLETGEARRAMEGDKSFVPEDHEIVIDGSLVGTKDDAGNSVPYKLSLNPITIDPDNEWVYYGGVNGMNVWRIRAEDLASDLTDEEMSSKVELYGPKASSDGIKVDGSGNVYITDVVNSAIGVTTAGKYEIVSQDDVLLSWIDGLAIGPDGAVYGTQNRLHANPVLNEGEDESVRPFRIVRIRP